MDTLSIHHEQFKCPSLSTLVIDGRNYYNACQQNASWTEMFPLVSVLSISRFSPVAIRSEPFTTFEFKLSLIPFGNRLVFFRLNDVELEESPTNVLDDDTEFDGLQTVFLQNLPNPRCVSQILDILGSSTNMSIIRCRLDSRTNCNGNLLLKEIDRSDDVIAFLKGCVVERLLFNDCRGFGNEVLNELMIARNPLTSSNCAQYVQDISIFDCPDFSISTLKKVVEARRIKHFPGDDDNILNLLSPRIRNLRLYGRVPDLLPEDRDWFEDHLSEFCYYPTH